MGVVKYTGPVASFHCPTNAEIRSLKVHFSPKQKGTGDPSPENIRPIVGWDGVVVHNDDGIMVPEEYQKVEYLKSSGTQYLNTGINGASGLNIECELLLNSNAAIYNCGMIGSRENNDNTRFYAISFYQNKWHIGMPYDSTFREVLTQVKYKVRLETTINKCTLYVNDEVYANVNSYQDTNYPLYVFACNNYGTAARFCSGRLYSLSITNGSSELLNYIPCRRKSDNKPGMYDTVTQTFFTNQGTGEFICGPDVGETVEYEFGVLGKNKFPAADGTTSDIFLAANTTYTLSATSPSAGYFKGWYEDETDTGLIWINAGADGDRRWRTFTPEKNIVRGLMFVSIGMSECQIELGSTATTYEPYDPKNTVYGGWVDLISGEVCETHYYEGLNETVENLSNEYMTENNVFFRCETTYPFALTNGATSGASGYVKDLMCETLESTVNLIWSTIDNHVNKITRRYNSVQKVCMVMQKSIFSITSEDILSEMKNKIDAYLNEHPIYVSYKMQAPITYHLAPTQLQTFLGQNNVWSNADYVEVEYDLHETQEILNRKAFIMANQPHLIAPGAAQLQSFTTDLAAPLKECKAYFKPKQDFNGYDRPWPGGGGKNLCDCYNSNNWRVAESPTSRTTTSNIGSISLNNNKVILNRTDSMAGLSIILGNLDANIEYTLSGIFNNIDNKAYIALLDSNISENYTCTRKFTLTFNNNNAVTFIPTESGIYELLIWKNGTGNISLSNLQLEKGSTATSYEPYENICPISGWTGMEVYETGKNLIDETFISNFDNYTIAGAYAYVYTDYIQLVPNTKYRFVWFDFDNSQMLTSDLYVDGAAEYILWNGTHRQYSNGFTTNTTGKIRFGINRGSYSTYQEALTAAFQSGKLLLQIGTDDIPYEPYNGTTIPITFPTEAGTIYGGYVDLVRGEVVEEWHKIVADGVNVKCNSSYMTDDIIAAGIVYLNPLGKYSNIIPNSFMDTIPVYSQIQDNHPIPLPYATVTNAGNQYVVFKIANRADYPEVTDANTCKEFVNNWLQEHPTTIVYELKTPIVHTLSPTQLKTLRGTNNIWSSANDNIEIKYFKH